jgi:SRSO17 transposase
VWQENREAAAAAIVEGERAVSNLADLHRLLEPCFGRVEPCGQAGKCIAAMMSDLPRKSGWTIAEYVGDSTPDRTQRLLNYAVWDTDRAMAVVRGCVAGHLADELVVGALDESGQQKQGSATAGVNGQYMGSRWAGRQRCEHGVLHLCRLSRARAGRGEDLGAGRAVGRPGPPGGNSGFQRV